MSHRSAMVSRVLWWYSAVLLCFWVTSPEIRRLLEWRGGFHSFDVVSVIPLLATFPLAIWASLRGASLPRSLILLLWIWLGSFFYAGVMGWLLGQGRSAIYDFLQFVAPAFLALWVASEAQMTQTFRRLSTLLLAIGVVVSLYGILQYVALPSWDAAWMQNALRVQGLGSTGVWSAYQLRVFSVLNSPAPCGTFLAVVLAINLYRMQESRIIPLAAMCLCVATLALTLVRSAWIALFVAVVAYILCGRRPIRTFSIFVSVMLVVSALFIYVSPWLAAKAGRDVIAQRVQTFWNLQSDSSVNARASSSEELLSEAQEHPTGQGLGVIGGASRLTSFTEAVNSTDGGFQARLVEMGFVGFAGYFGALLLAFGLTLKRCMVARQSTGCAAQGDMLAALVAVQVALIAMDLSLDAHVNLVGALFWITVGLAAAPATGAAPSQADLKYAAAQKVGTLLKSSAR